ncbi:L-ascorbate metabolism protein UlaG (beta-lactamase superfamily) [Sphingomonas sp. SORGH_AS 950]|uniref:MBL fold metallo-hydrolase n=1 Tax=Sphingomonas sp. SORGH_AS_0950 TaxID=3041792 RepID=UPI002786C3DE|nr:MBL fold metallo-hydrolase [Sphingomonas sp. SORGH_AS_0950]MDQ1157038.1 L-ascorbate metabolism protein UlaG (beta-lactamase superfamily) [Sphingomonas sp. SORGH_AS_0950]
MARNRYYDGPPSDHFDGTRFFNPGQASTDRGLRAVLRWKLAGAAAKWPVTVPVTPAMPRPRVDGLSVTMVGHAALLIQAAGMNILTDPVWSERASPFRRVGPKRVTAPGIPFEALPPIDVVLLSHAHYDHLDIATLRRLHAVYDPLMAMPLGNDAVVRAGVPGARCVTGDWWDRIDLGNGVATTLTPANHWSNRWPSDTRMTLWSGHYLETRAGTIWFVGDTGYGDGAIFRQVGERLGPPDVALIPIGAYEPRWFMAAQHVDPADAVRIFTDVDAGRALGIHWGTFQLTDEARDAPAEELAAALDAAGIPRDRFVAAEPGGVYHFGRTPVTSR